MKKLTPEATIADAFDFFTAAQQGGVQVVPVTIKQQEDDTQLAIFISGEHQMASVIMAELMTKIDELFDYSQQSEASNAKPAIITG